MINNIDLFASIQASKPKSSTKKADFFSNSSGKANSFRDSLKEAARSIHQDNNEGIRKELVSKSEIKLKSVDKQDPTIDEKTGSNEEDKEKQIEKITNRMDEILSNLQELANLQQAGEIPPEKQSLLLDRIKEAYQELTALQNKLTKLGEAKLQTEMPRLQAELGEFKTLLEGILNELKADGNTAGNDNNSNFLQKLESVIEETIPKLEKIADALAENNKVQPDSNKLDNTTDTTNTDVNEPDKAMGAQGQEKAEGKAAEGRQNGEAAGNLSDEVKAEAAGAENKTLKKESGTRTETSEGTVAEEEKAALEGKTGKVTVENKENRKQDTEPGTGKEASKEVYTADSTKQNKPANEDMSAIRLGQTVTEDIPEVITSKADTPRTQTVNRAEIINQIVKKAELVLTDAQSEMRMQLEPENLGKLTLKVAVERGLITAKFTAESYEVKQVIESSFNELKDMLQEKGLEVQNFSVSVGQDNREYNNSNAFQQWKETVKLNGSSINKGSYDGYLNNETGAVKVVNPYSVHNGEFDHIA